MPRLLFGNSFSQALPWKGRFTQAFRHLPLMMLLAALAAMVFFAPALQAQPAPQITQPVDAARLQALPDHLPQWANPANSAGALPPDLMLNPMTMVLQRSPEQESAFESLLAEQQNAASPNYRHWLTPAQIGERFGLSQQDIETLSGWLQSEGLRVNWVSPSRLFIGFSGTAAQLGRTFHTEFRSYRVNGEERISAASDPMIPAALIPAVKAIYGLYTVEDRPAVHGGAAQAASPDEDANSGNHYIAPADFDVIYDLPAALTGSGQTIGIVGRSRTDFADFDNFKNLTGSTFTDPTEVVPTAFGGIDPGPAVTSCASPPCNYPGDQGEATLDVLRAGSVAPGASLLLVVATSASGGIGTDAQYLVQTTPVPAQVMNISFLWCEAEAGPSNVAFWDTLFQQAAGEGISAFVCSGDSGASGCDADFEPPPANPAANSPNYICSSSYATCVGGTEFNDASDPSAYWKSSNGAGLLSAIGYIPEGAWNEAQGSSGTQVAASGGGVSAYIPTPAWQTGTGVPAADAGRYTPDVAFSASAHDGYFGCLAAVGSTCVTGSNGSYSFEYFYGTSAAAPSMAGITALLNQEQGSAQGNLNPLLYQMAARVPSAFHDVTAASSGVADCSIDTASMCNNSAPSRTSLTGGQEGYLVTDGYDEVTGLGSLDVQAFVDNFLPAGDTKPTVTVSGTVVSVSPGAVSGNTSTVTVSPANGFTGTVTLSAAVTSSPAGAQYPPTLSFGSTSPVTITGASAATAILTVTTTAPSTTALARPSHGGLFWPGASAALACLVLFGLPARRRRWLATFATLGLLFILAGSALGCGGGGSGGGCGSCGQTIPGTTAGTYIVTVTCTASGATVATGTLTLRVQ
jgi:subtilase family serine protease